MDTEDSPVPEMNAEDTLALLTSVMRAARKNISSEETTISMETPAVDANPMVELDQKLMAIMGVAIKRRDQQEVQQEEPNCELEGMEVDIKAVEEEVWGNDEDRNTELSTEFATVKIHNSNRSASDVVPAEKGKPFEESAFQSDEEISHDVATVDAVDIAKPMLVSGVKFTTEKIQKELPEVEATNDSDESEESNVDERLIDAQENDRELCTVNESTKENNTTKDELANDDIVSEEKAPSLDTICTMDEAIVLSEESVEVLPEVEAMNDSDEREESSVEERPSEEQENDRELSSENESTKENNATNDGLTSSGLFIDEKMPSEDSICMVDEGIALFDESAEVDTHMLAAVVEMTNGKEHQLAGEEEEYSKEEVDDGSVEDQGSHDSQSERESILRSDGMGHDVSMKENRDSLCLMEDRGTIKVEMPVDTKQVESCILMPCLDSTEGTEEEVSEECVNSKASSKEYFDEEGSIEEYGCEQDSKFSRENDWASYGNATRSGLISDELLCIQGKEPLDIMDGTTSQARIFDTENHLMKPATRSQETEEEDVGETGTDDLDSWFEDTFFEIFQEGESPGNIVLPNQYYDGMNDDMSLSEEDTREDEEAENSIDSTEFDNNLLVAVKETLEEQQETEEVEICEVRNNGPEREHSIESQAAGKSTIFDNAIIGAVVNSHVSSPGAHGTDTADCSKLEGLAVAKATEEQKQHVPASAASESLDFPDCGNGKAYDGIREITSTDVSSSHGTTTDYDSSLEENQAIDDPSCQMIEETSHTSLVGKSGFPGDFEKCAMITSTSKHTEEKVPHVAETDNSDDSCDEGSGNDSNGESSCDSSADDSHGGSSIEEPSEELAANGRDEDVSTFPIREQIVDLIRTLCPEEASSNMEAMFVQFKNREEELLDTLHVMKERRERVRARAAFHKARARPVPRLHEVPGLSSLCSI
jgi:hypothetical protein